MIKFKVLFCTTFFMLFISCFDLIRSENNFKDLTKHKNWPLLDFATSCGRRIRDYDGDEDESDSEIKVRIFGGRDAAPHEFPWLVQPLIKRLFLLPLDLPLESGKCGGSVINNRYVLTAAHCCRPPDDVAIGYSYSVKLNGNVNFNEKPLAVEHVRIHEGYEDDSFLHDICLMRLDKPINFTGTVQPVCLPSDRKWLTKELTGLNMTIAGWGVTHEEPQTFPERLQKIDVAIVPMNHCISEWRNFAPPIEVYPISQFCGGTAMKDACAGDSGGPVMYRSYEGPPRYFLLGLVSFGQPCITNKTTEPSVFVRVSNYMSWILDNIYE